MYASHCLKQLPCLALQVIIFLLRTVACDVSVSFSNVFTSVFGPVFFSTYEAPQGHQQRTSA